MIAAMLSAVWVTAVFAGGFALRPSPARRVGGLVAPALREGFASSIGSTIRRLARRQPNPSADKKLGRLALLALPACALDIRLGLGVGVAVLLWPIHEARVARRRQADEVVRELPEVIELVRLSMSSGGAVLPALREVSERPVGPVTEALAEVCVRVDRGHRLTDALQTVVSATTDDVRPLVRSLSGSEHYGTELTATLRRLGAEAREVRRRRAQAAARQIPVRLLLPLVMCVLPAFVLLTLVPTLAGTLNGLDFG